MEHLEKLGEILLNLRGKHRFRQEYVAHKLSISQPQYSRLERGEKDAMLGDFFIIAQLYRLDVHDLLHAIIHGEDTTMPSPTKFARQEQNGDDYAAKYKALYEEYKAMAFTYLRLYIALCEKYHLDFEPPIERQSFQSLQERLGDR